MLAEELSSEHLFDKLASKEWLMQIKHNGYRGLLAHNNGTCRLYTRSGPTQIEWKVSNHFAQFVLDVEMFGNELAIAFDLLEWDGFDYREQPLHRRISVLESVQNVIEDCCQGLDILVTATAATPKAKKAMSKRGREGNVEGFVFKQKDSKYHEAERLPTWLKYKLRYAAYGLIVSNSDAKGNEVAVMMGNKLMGKAEIKYLPTNVNPGKIVQMTYNWITEGNERIVGAEFIRVSDSQDFHLVEDQPLNVEPKV